MNLYLITQTVNNGYDTYDAALVAAKTEEEARFIHPSDHFDGWCNAKDVQVKLIGIAKRGTKKGLILASFNAG